MNLFQRWKQTTIANQLMVVTTALVAFGTLFYVVVAIFQYCLMKESARQASEQTDKLIAATQRMADTTRDALNEAKRSNEETANRAERAIQVSKTLLLLLLAKPKPARDPPVTILKGDIFSLDIAAFAQALFE